MAEEEKTVDIDTSGPGAEVELPVEESKNEQQTEKTNEDQVETKIEDGASTDDTSAKSDEHSNVQEETVEETKEQKDKRFSEDEIKKYGFNVKRRIGREVAKRREAERQRDEVSEYTKLIMAERDKLKSRLEKLDTNYVSEVETRIKSGVEAAQIKLAKAREENDIKSEVEAQKEISRLGFEEARLNELKTSQAKKEQIMQQPQEEAVAPQQRPPIDEKTQEWIDTNKSWFGKVKGMTATAYDIHDDLMNEGYEGSSDDYFSELDRRLRVEFPNKFDKVDEPTTEKAKPAQTVASAKRPAATGRNKTVSLTPTEVAIARRIGVSLEDYAREKIREGGQKHMTNEQMKTSRASQSRQAEEKPKVWTPPNALEAPPAPDGYRQRWLSTEIRGQDNSNNIANKLRAGWSLVRADAYPGQHYNSHTEGKYAGMIGSGGLVLARIPEEIARQRDEYYARMAREKDEAVNNDLLKEQHPSMPINQDRQTRVTFGGTKK